EADRKGRGRRLSGECSGGSAGRGDHAHSTANEIGRQLRQAIKSAFRPAIFNRHVLALDVTGVCKAPPKRGYKRGPLGSGGGVNEPDHRHRRLLRARCERPRRRAAEQRDELATLHSITSSARASSDGGMVRPIALAVVRLMTSSNLVGCSTEIPAGFAPRKILSTNSAARRNWASMLGP